jgi:hypothetical protein
LLHVALAVFSSGEKREREREGGEREKYKF